MRRTMGVLAGAGTVLALAGATAYAVTGDSTVPADTPRPAVTVAAPRTGATAAPDRAPAAGATADRRRSTAAPAGSAARRAELSDPPVRQRIGTLETVTRLLGYLGGPATETFHYPGASYVKLHFDRLLLLPGDYVTVSDPSGAEVYRYEAPGLGAGLLNRVLGGEVTEAATGRWAMSITGDTAVLKLHRGSPDLLGLGSAVSRLGVGVDKVARGHTPAERVTPAESGPAGPGREESICGADQKLDAVCYRSADPVAYTHSKAVARLLINGVELCTGWRVGAGNRMLTNNHCFDTSAEAYDTEVWFNYQCAKCGGYEVFRSTKVWGDQVVATDRTLDFTVFTVENFDAVKKFGHLLLDGRRPVRGEELYVPQHPGGDPTMIAGVRGQRAGNCAVVDRSYDGYAADSDVSYYCDTEGGSSGSPVISRQSGKVVALHHFGGCPNSGVRGDLVLERVKRLI